MNGLTQRHRAQQLVLRRAVRAEFERLWPALDFGRLDESFPALAVRVAALVARRRETSAGLAAEYLRLFRREAGVRGQVRVVFAEQVGPAELSAVLHSTSVAPVKAATARGTDPASAMSAALSLASGATVRLVLNGGRDTLARSAVADPASSGWRRVLGGGGCDYCRERAGVRMTDSTVFEAHGSCGCTAEPIY